MRIWKYRKKDSTDFIIDVVNYKNVEYKGNLSELGNEITISCMEGYADEMKEHTFFIIKITNA